MRKFPLLLVDANIVIHLHKLGIWAKLIETCSVTVTSVVAYDEAYFWEDNDGEKQCFDIGDDIKNNKIRCERVPLDQVKDFHQQFDPTYSIHAGEAELLSFLFGSDKKWLIVSSDAIIFRVLGRTDRGAQGISLEEVLNTLGLGRQLDWGYTKKFGQKWTRQGGQDRITGRGMI